MSSLEVHCFLTEVDQFVQMFFHLSLCSVLFQLSTFLITGMPQCLTEECE